jgi:hypothetical protein
MNCTSLDISKSLIKIYSHCYFNKVVTKKEDRLKESNILPYLFTNATGPICQELKVLQISDLQDTIAMMVTKIMVAFKHKYLTTK